MIFGVLIAISTICLSAGAYIATARLFGIYCGVLICVGVAAKGIHEFIMHVIRFRIAKQRYVEGLLNGEYDDEEEYEDLDDTDEEDDDDQEV